MSWFKLVSGCALGIAATLAATATASAQWQQSQYDYVSRSSFYGERGGYYGGGATNFGGYYNAPAAAPDYASYYAPRAEYIVPQNAALIDMRVPANAEVFFSGERTQQNGAERSFVTPNLEPGQRYAYNVKVVWTDAKGQRVEREKKVAIRAGARLNLQFE